jgi:transposase
MVEEGLSRREVSRRFGVNISTICKWVDPAMKTRAAAMTKNWVEQNRSRARAAEKAWRKKNEEAVKERDKKRHSEYYNKNKDKLSRRQAEYRKQNPDKVRAGRAAYKKQNLDKVAASASRRRARMRGVPQPHSIIEKLMVQNYYEEAARLSKETGVPHHVDHIWPISKGGPHLPWNLQVITGSENCSKGARI